MVNRKDLDPTSGRWAPFGVQLRRSREAAGLTQSQLAKLIDFHYSTVSFAELGTKQVSLRFARAADSALKTHGTLALMWQQASNSAGLAEGFTEFAGFEAKAKELRLYEVSLMPGLLQTPEYAEAELSEAVLRGEITTDQADERLNFRLTRQQLLSRAQPPLIYVALAESVIRWSLGSAGIMAQQLRHLEDLAACPNVLVQVVPFSLGTRPYQSAVTLLTMPDENQLGYTEIPNRGFLERDRPTVAIWRRRYDRLQVEAPMRAVSLDVIRTARKDLST
ncbi:Scr1 family TA system antitoxin-like transcriptional regulator [Kitasatospora sp. NPDC056181]|uniref:helix-turn-helix domain-containing protein n=1 Tax=Kitasatospora sp. NPDC056181 TaxID=3345737 RepID=UPI0035E00001